MFAGTKRSEKKYLFGNTKNKSIMSKLPQISANELIKIFNKIGFDVIRQSGSHVFLKHRDGRTTVIPNHPGEKIDGGLLNKILKKDINISREEFENLLQ